MYHVLTAVNLLWPTPVINNWKLRVHIYRSDGVLLLELEDFFYHRQISNIYNLQKQDKQATRLSSINTFITLVQDPFIIININNTK